MPLICALKFTHDGGLAVVEELEGRAHLVAAAEVEKHGNRRRHAPLTSLDLLEELSREIGLDLEDVDRFVVDGWNDAAVRSGIEIASRGANYRIRTAPYGPDGEGPPPMHSFRPPTRLPMKDGLRSYTSFRHAETHLAAAYMTSPAAEVGEDAFVLVWDGGLFPELYQVRRQRHEVSHIATLFSLRGSLYSRFSVQVEPFVPEAGLSHRETYDLHLTLPGKVMAFAGFGEGAHEITDFIVAELRTLNGAPDAPEVLHQRVSSHVQGAEVDAATLLSSFQSAVGRLLVERLERVLSPRERARSTLCIGGGSALNIKWNAMIRDHAGFETVWVPPFPNDSGSAIGAACASVWAESGIGALRWSVYGGPPIRSTIAPAGWHSRPFSSREVGHLLDDTGEPVVVLTGRAELGPRALGHRSILAPATRPEMQSWLNRMKGREGYRPVAPICLEHASSEVFDPGGSDPFMVFDHSVRPAWSNRIPAVVHADGTARLQTIDRQRSPVVFDIVAAYAESSGIPVLCNTSANLPGRGFFPDAASALAWGRTRYVWSEGTLYERCG